MLKHISKLPSVSATLFLKGVLVLALISVPLLHSQAQEASKDWQSTVGTAATQSRREWQKLTTGTELARGKKVFFSPSPNYNLTTDENDPYDLTDGTLSSRLDDRVWFNKDAVGWTREVICNNGAFLQIDLGAEQPVGQIAIRVLGGHEQNCLDLPESVEFLASSDGKHYYSLQNMVKLHEAEKAQSNFKTSFYVPEEGTAFMYPFVCRKAVRARYIAVRMTLTSGAAIFTDQISVLKADDATPLKNLTSFPKALVYTDGIAVEPRHEPFVVTTNITTPNWLTVQDNSGLDPAREKLGFRLELPDGLNVLPLSRPGFQEVASSKPGVHDYEFQYKGSGSAGPLWIEKKPSVTIPAGAKITLTGMVQGKDSHVLQFPLKLVTIPETHPLKGLEVSLAWMYDPVEQSWPNFLRDFHKMGFGYVSTFPRDFGKNADGSWNAATLKNLDFLRQARAAGYGIVYDESPFHVMWSQVQADQKAGKIDPAEAEQLYTQIGGHRGQSMNILYRGRYFQNEIKRIADLAALVQPDHVYLDIEWWGASVNESKNDPRVVQAWKQSGKSWDDFVTDIGTDVLGTLVQAMRKAVPARKLTVGLYDAEPQNAICNSIFEWKKIYPAVVDIAMPSLYVQGRPSVVSTHVREDYNATRARQTIPWLSTGTYGEFNPALTEPMVLEAILNGARGVTYFQFDDFDPLDFYYHSKALAALAPYEQLLQTGKPLPYKGDNPHLHYTAFASSTQALLLVGNYNDSGETHVRLPLPLQTMKKAQMDGKPLIIKNKTIGLNVPPGEFRLLSFSSGP